MFRLSVCFVAMALFLSGCGAFEKMQATRNDIESNIAEIEFLRSQMRDLLAAHATQVVAPATKPKVTPRLPEKFSQNLSYSATEEALDTILVEISRQSGLPIWLTEFTLDGSSNIGQKPISFQYEGTLQGLLDHLAQITKLHWRFLVRDSAFSRQFADGRTRGLGQYCQHH